MAVVPLLILVFFVVALIDIILRDSSQVKHLPKVAWIFIVILLPLIGGVLWFAVGREYSGAGYRRPRGTYVARDQAAPAARPLSTEEQLAALEREIEDDRIRQLEAELRSRRDLDPDPNPS
ncbi:PLD nuclease N-terminal domain-containing protein [Leifsonia sp. NPDC056665]|uniref:PLD nuclease N-terminal domain-containing protein n=1 Tax=Leifsonia sp. NPDC056665 TaxID=3345901 RepID=UPI003692B6E2